MSNRSIADVHSRVNELIRQALAGNRSYEEQGSWSRADFDELEMLVEIAGERLPLKFRKLISEGYDWAGDKQAVLAERLQRVLAISADYIHLQSDNSAPVSLTPTFSLNDDDKARVLELSAKMRSIILSSPIFDDAHRRRLLDRISAIEKQVHQTKGKMDVILGGVSDVGDTLKKFGTDLKPLTDRMSEIKRITQSNSSEYDQLPSPEELEKLPPPEDQD